MKSRPLFLLCCLLLFSSTSLYGEEKSPRVRENLNREWLFILGDPLQAQAIEFDDSGWDPIGLPHSFSLPYFLSEDVYMGYGWYRKTIELSEADLERALSIEFEAAFQEVNLFVNGKLAGSHRGGYTGFQIDISPFVKQGRNSLAISVNNLWNPQIAPRAGEHQFSGGIYRDLYLVKTAKVHVDWYGTSITTPRATKEEALVEVVTEVVNELDRKQRVQLKTTLLDPYGIELATLVDSRVLKAGEHYSFLQKSKRLSEPKLWNINTPYLYQALTQLYIGEELVDQYSTTFGIRQLEWTANRGFFINGEHLYLKGANVHQDQAGWGDGVTNAAIRRDLMLIKEAGFNFVRGSHYPHDPYFSQVCDELGLLFLAEGVIWGTGGFTLEEGYWNASAYPVNREDRRGFEESDKKQLSQLIRIHRNHPSIIAWSMSNEPFFTADFTLEPMRKLLEDCVELSHQLDPTRLAVIGGAQRPIGEGRIDFIGDIAGYNGDGGVIAEFQNPGIPNLVSEYGSTTAIRPGRFEPGWGDLAKNKSQDGVEWRSGHAIWCAFDHGSIAGHLLGKMGIVDYFRIPKRAWYWYRKELRGIAEPKWPEPGLATQLRLTADKREAIASDGTDDAHLLVEVLNGEGIAISNSPVVTLRIVSGPGEFPTGSQITFNEASDIPILDGMAAIAIRSYYGGETVVEASSPGLKSAQIKLQFVGDCPYVEGQSPRVKERPFFKFTRNERANTIYSFGRNNPAFASSSHPNHNEGMATDGDLESYWSPLAEDRDPHWILDSERNLIVSHIELQFGQQANLRFTVEISSDKENWESLYRHTDSEEPIDKIRIEPPHGVKGRFIRISFSPEPGVQPKLAEVILYGKMIN